MVGVDGRALENECRDAIASAAITMGYLAHYEITSTWSNGRYVTAAGGSTGWPDLTIVGYGHLFIYELKRKGNGYEPGQERWIKELAEVPSEHVHVGVLLVPDHQDLFINRLQQVRDERLG